MKRKVIQPKTNTVNFDELKNSDFIGFIGNGNKGTIIYNGINGLIGTQMRVSAYMQIVTPNAVWSGEGKRTVQEVLSSLPNDWCKDVYVFDTRKELYQWLAE